MHGHRRSAALPLQKPRRRRTLHVQGRKLGLSLSARRSRRRRRKVSRSDPRARLRLLLHPRWRSGHLSQSLGRALRLLQQPRWRRRLGNLSLKNLLLTLIVLILILAQLQTRRPQQQGAILRGPRHRRPCTICPRHRRPRTLCPRHRRPCTLVPPGSVGSLGRLGRLGAVSIRTQAHGVGRALLRTRGLGRQMSLNLRWRRESATLRAFMCMSTKRPTLTRWRRI